MIGITSMKPEIRGWDDVADLDFIEPVEALNALLPEVSEKSDVNIVLSHAGNPEDHKLAQVPGVFGGNRGRYTQGHRNSRI
ncbi:hypothetical protein RCO48_15985 [Peribacillus frigoritolerans]|nr:hypothetical protein [Peribacillus frigoritolerans]